MRRGAELDAADELAAVRGRFVLPDDVTYLDGNSLGPPARTVADRLARLVDDEWATGLIRSWNDADWVGLPRRCADLLAPWLGAADGSRVTVADSTTVNLAKAVGAGLAARPGRRTVLTVQDGFPTDAYATDALLGFANMVRPDSGRAHRQRAVPWHEVVDHLDDDVAVVCLPHVDYRSGRRFDVGAVTAAAHEVGALAVWDAAHSAGALALAFDDWRVDLAVGCSYKFLNAGPGGPAWLYVGAHVADVLANPIAGWFGHADPFAFRPDWEPAAGAERFRAGTPSVLAHAAFEEALLAIDGVDPVAVEAKAASLTTLLLDLLDEAGLPDDVEVVTPRDPRERGAQVTLRLEHAWPVTRALADRGVVGDHRPPDLLRLGLAPLVTRHVDVEAAVATLLDVLATEAWRDPRFADRAVVP